MENCECLCDDLPEIDWCRRNGSGVVAWGYVFDIDITGIPFYFESNPVVGSQQKTLQLGDGLTLVGANTLVFDAYIEDRFAGMHEGFLKCIDPADNLPSILFKVNIEVLPKVVEAPEI
jgi:hypothetical protein